MVIAFDTLKACAHGQRALVIQRIIDQQQTVGCYSGNWTPKFAEIRSWRID